MLAPRNPSERADCVQTLHKEMPLLFNTDLAVLTKHRNAENERSSHSQSTEPRQRDEPPSDRVSTRHIQSRRYRCGDEGIRFDDEIFGPAGRSQIPRRQSRAMTIPRKRRTSSRFRSFAAAGTAVGAIASFLRDSTPRQTITEDML